MQNPYYSNIGAYQPVQTGGQLSVHPQAHLQPLTNFASPQQNINPQQYSHNSNVMFNSSAAQNPAFVAAVPRNPSQFNKTTLEKAATLRVKVEHFYKMAVQHAIERNQRRSEIENLLQSDCCSEEKKARQLHSLRDRETQFMRLRRTRLSLEDFRTIKVIGKGAFGEVRLVQKTDTGRIYAMKLLLKSEMLKKDQLAHVKSERDILAESDSPWVVSLFYSFQDEDFLYLIMEFLPGGDMMTMLIKYDTFTEDVTRFYIAEILCAIDAVHSLGFIHRDIKPDNILIDASGHIKLSDFGLSTGFHKTHSSQYYKNLINIAKGHFLGTNVATTEPDIWLTQSYKDRVATWKKNRRLMAYSTVGTPDYIAPEIFLQQGYTNDCDFWSLGAIMFECLIGYPPFCSDNSHETCRKILNWRETLQFPEDVHISSEAEDLIRNLMTSSSERLGHLGGAEEIKKHPFFSGVNWTTIRKIDAPFIPQLNSITDTSYFPTDELDQRLNDHSTNHAGRRRPNSNVNSAAANFEAPFVGYTFKRYDYLTRKNLL